MALDMIPFIGRSLFYRPIQRDESSYSVFPTFHAGFYTICGRSIRSTSVVIRADTCTVLTATVRGRAMPTQTRSSYHLKTFKQVDN